jgi:integrase
MATKIGLRDVANLQPNQILWDETVRGLCCRRQRSETITWSVVYRNRDQQQKWFKVGRYPILTPTLARQEAIKILRSVTLGGDPSAERHSVRNSMTVSQLRADYTEAMDAQRIKGKKASTIYTDKIRINKHIVPGIGKFKVVTISQDQIENWMNGLSQGSARRIIGLTGAIFSWAAKRKLRPDNPVRGIETPKDGKRLRRLSDSEYAQLYGALQKCTAPMIADIFFLLAVSGYRSGEIRCLRWSEIDFDRKIATLTDTKSGLSIRPLSSIALEIIQRQPRNGEYVFGFHRGKPVTNLTQHWARLSLDKTITPHILRHSFASLAGDLGLADSTIAGLLGHARTSITSRYIHLDKSLIAAADLVAAETLRLMKA